MEYFGRSFKNGYLMKTRKLNLEILRVQSFVTCIDPESQ
jgi:hypothetical protein